MASSFFDDPPQDGETCQESECAIEPAAIGDRIEMTPHDQRAVRFAPQRDPPVARRVASASNALRWRLRHWRSRRRLRVSRSRLPPQRPMAGNPLPLSVAVDDRLPRTICCKVDWIIFRETALLHSPDDRGQLAIDLPQLLEHRKGLAAC